MSGLIADCVTGPDCELNYEPCVSERGKKKSCRRDCEMCVCVRHEPEGAETVESYDWFPGTTRPCAPGKTSGGGRKSRQTDRILAAVTIITG